MRKVLLLGLLVAGVAAPALPGAAQSGGNDPRGAPPPVPDVPPPAARGGGPAVVPEKIAPDSGVAGLANGAPPGERRGQDLPGSGGAEQNGGAAQPSH
jgi:hypothetical protein